MSREIAVTLLGQLGDEGLKFSPSFLEVLRTSFERESREALRRSRHLALINGLPEPKEDEEAAAVFARALAEAGREFFDDPSAATARALSAWGGLQRTSPDWVARFLEAVARGIG
jgi:hypothetical protein